MKKIKYICALVLAALFVVGSPATAAAERVVRHDDYGRELAARFFYWRNTLDGGLEQALYNQIYATAMAYETIVPVNFDLRSDRALAIFEAVLHDNPHIFWVSNYFLVWYDENDMILEIELSFTMPVADIPAARARFDFYADYILGHAKTFAYEGERVRFIYDVLSYFVVYDMEMVNDQSAFGAVVYRRAVCMGYSLAFTYFMQRLGIPAATVTGRAGGEYHAWNIVNLGGLYYSMDVTWDATAAPPGISSFDWFVLSDADFRTHTRDAASNRLPRTTGRTDTLRHMMVDLPATDMSRVNLR